MRNYFNYFTEIEERFQQRRGSILLLSTLDWALIETWHEAGIPLDAALRGIDAAFDKYEQRQKKGAHAACQRTGLVRAGSDGSRRRVARSRGGQCDEPHCQPPKPALNTNE